MTFDSFVTLDFIFKYFVQFLLRAFVMNDRKIRFLFISVAKKAAYWK